MSAQRENAAARADRQAASPGRPAHYKVVCVSIYTRDLAELDAKVAALKARGFTRANRSQLIRLAVARLDIDGITGAIDTAPDLETAATA